MADAVSYLCRVALEEDLAAVLPDLIEVRRKLVDIASAKTDRGDLPRSDGDALGRLRTR